jgi:bifunctional non-homologous end joining protein LigD
MSIPTYSPMLATRWPQPFSDPEWGFEVKWDGVRAVVHWDGSDLTVFSRSGRSIIATYPELDRLDGLAPCILDGEIVALDDRGRPSFGRLQQRMNVAVAGAAQTVVPISFMAFDVLYLAEPLITATWRERRARLAALELPAPFVVPEAVAGEGEALWAGIREEGLEGMVAKRMDSPYRPGVRSPDWRKVARVDQVRAVVGGFLPGVRSRATTFGSLLLGLVDGDRLRYIGSVGTGFDGPSLQAIRAALDEMVTAASPFQSDAEIAAHAVFVEPALTALVEFKEWTQTGKLRAPAFKGFTDEDWSTLTWSAEGPPEH